MGDDGGGCHDAGSHCHVSSSHCDAGSSSHHHHHHTSYDASYDTSYNAFVTCDIERSASGGVYGGCHYTRRDNHHYYASSLTEQRRRDGVSLGEPYILRESWRRPGRVPPGIPVVEGCPVPEGAVDGATLQAVVVDNQVDAKTVVRKIDEPTPEPPPEPPPEPRGWFDSVVAAVTGGDKPKGKGKERLTARERLRHVRTLPHAVLA